MDNCELHPGDKVVDLGALLRSAAVFSGTAAAGLSVWFLTADMTAIGLAALFGGVAGYLLGSAVRFLDHLGMFGLATVVKLGPSALVTALKSGLFGGITAGIITALVPPLALTGAPGPIGLLALGAILGAAVGATFAYLATRP